MGLKTVSLKLTAFYGAVFGCIMLALCTMLYLLFAKELYQSADRAVEREASILAKTISIHVGGLTQRKAQRLEAAMKHVRATGLERGIMEQGKYIQILDRSGHVLYRSPNLVDHALPVNRTSLEKPIADEAPLQPSSPGITSPNLHHVRILTLPFQKEALFAFFVQIGYYPDEIQWTLRGLLNTLLILTPGALLLACLAGWTMTRMRLRPISKIAEAARRIGARELNQKIEIYQGRDEIGRLVEAFNEMLRRLNETFAALRRFTDDASHELRTPISIMKGEVEVALKRSRSPEEYQQVLKSMVEEIEFMSKIVEGLWILSRGECGGLMLELEPISLDGLLSEVCEEAKMLARGKSLSVSLGTMEEVTVKGDKRLVKQLLYNLVDNAIKYTPVGGRITLSLEKTPPSALILIEDTGIGIPEESLPRIFDRFYRVDKVKAREIGGSGLGLSICKWITEAHGGTIEVSSRLGHGTKVSVRLLLQH